MQNNQILAQIIKISPSAGETLIFKIRTDQNGIPAIPLQELKEWWENLKKELYNIYPDVNFICISDIIDYKGVACK